MNTLFYIEAYYVDPENGDDSNPGTAEFPFKTIQKGVNIAQANANDSNQIFLQGGIYNLSEPIEIEGNGGIEESWLTIQPIEGETVILDGSQVTREDALVYIKDAQYINIIGLEIRNAPSHGIEVINGQQINISNNLIYNTQGMGIRVRGYIESLESEGDTTVQSNNIFIDNNGVYQTNLSNSGTNKGFDNWGAGIQAWNVDNVTINNNVVGENYGEGIGLTLADDSAITNNTLYDNYSAQIYLDNVRDSIVEANFAYDTDDERFDRRNLPAQGITLANEIHDVAKPETFRLDNNLIQQNVIMGANSGIIYGTWAGRHQDDAESNFLGLRNTIITQNIIYDSESYTVELSEDSNNHNVNIYDNIFVQESENDLTSVDSLTGINFNHNLWSGGDAGAGYSSTDIFADPLFVNPGGNSITDYELQADSLGVDLLIPQDINTYWTINESVDLSNLEFERFSLADEF